MAVITERTCLAPSSTHVHTQKPLLHHRLASDDMTALQMHTAQKILWLSRTQEVRLVQSQLSAQKYEQSSECLLQQKLSL